MRCLLLCGGNAAGKTTAVSRLEELVQSWPKKQRKRVKFIHADMHIMFRRAGGKGIDNIGKQFKALMKLWTNRKVDTIVIEGVWIYSTVLRCARQAKLLGHPRTLHVAVLAQSVPVGVYHLEMRTLKNGRTFRRDYWDHPDRCDQFSVRYRNAVRNYAHLIDETEEFWIGRDYAQVASVVRWLGRRMV